MQRFFPFIKLTSGWPADTKPQDSSIERLCLTPYHPTLFWPCIFGAFTGDRVLPASFRSILLLGISSSVSDSRFEWMQTCRSVSMNPLPAP